MRVSVLVSQPVRIGAKCPGRHLRYVSPSRVRAARDGQPAIWRSFPSRRRSQDDRSRPKPRERSLRSQLRCCSTGLTREMESSARVPWSQIPVEAGSPPDEIDRGRTSSLPDAAHRGAHRCEGRRVGGSRRDARPGSGQSPNPVQFQAFGALAVLTCLAARPHNARRTDEERSPAASGVPRGTLSPPARERTCRSKIAFAHR